MNQYTEEEKLLLLKEYVESGKGPTVFAREKGIPYQTLYGWKSAYGFPDNKDIAEMVKSKNIPNDVQLLQSELVRLRKEKDAEIKRLQKELNEEKLKNLANETMINLAERRFHIQVRKKSDAK